MTSRLKIAVIAGEESGDQLGADLIMALRRKTAREIDLIGVGGAHLGREGLKSFFDPDEIALMGLGAVIKKLPRLIRLISRLATFIAQEKPDCLIIIDSPDFTHRVARKVRALDPGIPIINYVTPSVWAWRPGRAQAMTAYIDHALVVLPFETQVMKNLAGPPATYVGHRLLSYPPLLGVRSQRKAGGDDQGSGRKRGGKRHTGPLTLVVLPGSRRFEIRRLMPVFGLAVQELKERVPDIEIVLPTLPAIAAELRSLAAYWPVKPRIVVGEDEKWRSFQTADAALAASGTVSLELALCGVPMVLAYQADLFSKIFIMPRVTAWSAALPNIIADEPVVPEYFNEFVRAGMLSRQVERHLVPGPARAAQLEGFEKVAAAMHTEKPSGQLAAEAILPFLAKTGQMAKSG